MYANPRLVIVAEKAMPPRFAATVLRQEGLDPVWEHVARAKELAGVLARSPRPHLILCSDEDDQAIPMDVIRTAATAAPGVPVVVIASNMTVSAAVDLIKAGADDVVQPDDAQRFVAAVNRAVGNPDMGSDFDQLGNAVFHAAREAILVTDAEHCILAVNAGFVATSGYEEAEVLGKTPRFLASGRGEPGLFRKIWEAVERAGHWEGEVWNRRKNGEVYPEWLSISVMRDGDGRIIRHIGILSDISERKRDEQALQHRAHYDPLTNLPNRALGLDRLAHAMSTARRRRSKMAVMFVDLDNFKPVNDMLGHQAGDDLLCQVARRIESCIRESDTAFRFGGDEFVVIVTDIASEGAAAKVGNNVLDSLARPFDVRGRSVAISASIGIALYPKHGEDASLLVHVADEAMYAAKRAGKGRAVTAPDERTDAA